MQLCLEAKELTSTENSALPITCKLHAETQLQNDSESVWHAELLQKAVKTSSGRLRCFMRNSQQLLNTQVTGQNQGCQWNESERPGFRS